MLYTDSSAFAKQYLVEPGSDEAITLMAAANQTSALLVLYTEIGSAIARARRGGIISEQRARGALQELAADWEKIVTLDVTLPIVRHAAELCHTYALRAYDAVHLASALEWRGAIGEQITFATFDRALHIAAGTAGLEAWPESFDG